MGVTMKRRKERRGWAPDMEKRAGDEGGRQVKCLTADAGHVWMPSYDKLPPAVRRRLARSPFNICAACLQVEVGRKAGVESYFAVIEGIEKKLRCEEV